LRSVRGNRLLEIEALARQRSDIRSSASYFNARR
jgi:hypothetical protein